MLTHLTAIGKILFSLFGFVLVLSTIPRIRLYSIPLLTLSGVACFLFPFTLFGWGNIGIRLLQLLNIFAYALGSWIFIRNQKKGKARPFKDYCGFFLHFGLILGICAILSRYWELSKYDEYANYMRVVRSLLVFGEKTAEVTHPEYPYGMALIQYYFVSAGFYHEHILLFANAVTIFSAMFYLASYAKKAGLFSLLLCGASVLLAYILGNNRFPEIMLDNLIGCVFAAVLFSALRLSDHLPFWECFERVIIFGFFIQIKDACAAFLLVAFALIFYRQIKFRNSLPNFEQWKKMVLCGSLSCFPYISWFISLKLRKVERSQALGNITLNKIWNMILNLNEDTQVSHSFHTYIRKVFSEPCGTSNISVFGICLILFSAAVIIFLFTNVRHELGIALILLGGATAYRVYVGLAYTFVLGADYPLTFNEFDRFILSYLLGWALLVFCGLLYGFEWENRLLCVKICFVILTCFILIHTPWMDLFAYHAPDRKWIRTKQFANEYSDLLGKEDATFVLFNNDPERAMLVTLLFGKTNIATEYNFNLDEMNWSPEELHQFIDNSGANYVLADRPDKDFWTKYGSLFGGEPENTAVFHLYQIEDNGAYTPIR